MIVGEKSKQEIDSTLVLNVAYIASDVDVLNVTYMASDVNVLNVAYVVGDVHHPITINQMIVRKRQAVKATTARASPCETLVLCSLTSVMRPYRQH